MLVELETLKVILDSRLILTLAINNGVYTSNNKHVLVGVIGAIKISSISAKAILFPSFIS